MTAKEYRCPVGHKDKGGAMTAKHTPKQMKSGFGDLDTKLADWIDSRLRETTNLGKGSALVANDLVVNLPEPYAAAPETLEGCEFVIAFLDKLEDGTTPDDPLYKIRRIAHKPLRDKLEPIIRKARGE